jgi:hypothetical protein
MKLVQSLLWSAAHFSFSFNSQHSPGMQNEIADALSLYNWQEFRHRAQRANPSSPIPQALLEQLSPKV